MTEDARCYGSPKQRDLIKAVAAGIITAIRGLLRADQLVAASKHFLSYVVEGVKMDFVVDPLSSKEPRPTVSLDEIPVTVDRLVLSNGQDGAHALRHQLRGDPTVLAPGS